MTWLLCNWATLLSLFGTALEILGVFLMANRYKAVPWWQLVGALCSALRHGKRAKDLVAIAELHPERLMWTFQGLAFIAVGAGFTVLPGVARLLLGASAVGGAACL